MWQELYDEGLKLLGDNSSSSIMYGNCVCVVLGSNNKLYGAKSINSLEFKESALKWAILKMLDDGVEMFLKIALLNELGEAISPSTNELLWLYDMSKGGKNIEILVDEKKMEGKRIESIMPSWWGTCRLK